MGRRLQVLVLACCLPLVLPPGWCCWSLPQSGMSPAKAASPKADGLCCCHTDNEHPSEDNQPAPSRTPFKYCPCTDRNTIKQSVVTVEKSTYTVAFVGVPIGGASSPVAIGLDDGTDFVPVRPPPCPLHVLNCVWRC